MSQHTNVNIIAMADLFEDKLQKAKAVLNGLNAGKGFPEIHKSNIYQGSTDYLQLLQNKNVDAVLISLFGHWSVRTNKAMNNKW